MNHSEVVDGSTPEFHPGRGPRTAQLNNRRVVAFLCQEVLIGAAPGLVESHLRRAARGGVFWPREDNSEWPALISVRWGGLARLTRKAVRYALRRAKEEPRTHRVLLDHWRQLNGADRRAASRLVLEGEQAMTVDGGQIVSLVPPIGERSKAEGSTEIGQIISLDTEPKNPNWRKRFFGKAALRASLQTIGAHLAVKNIEAQGQRAISARPETTSQGLLVYACSLGLQRHMVTTTESLVPPFVELDWGGSSRPAIPAGDAAQARLALSAHVADVKPSQPPVTPVGASYPEVRRAAGIVFGRVYTSGGAEATGSAKLDPLQDAPNHTAQVTASLTEASTPTRFTGTAPVPGDVVSHADKLRGDETPQQISTDFDEKVYRSLLERTDETMKLPIGQIQPDD